MKQKGIKNEGITLLALVITIIVLIILSAITISALMGENGLITRTIAARDGTEVARVVELEQLQFMEGKIAKQNLVTNGSWNGVINTPKLADGMIPIAWDSNNNEFVPETDDEWYNYEAQKGTTENGGTSRWANAKTEDGSYWVWIPRFEYRIDYTGVVQGVDTDITKAGKIEVNFIEISQTTPTNGYTIHPAFINDINIGGWDSEIPGFWVAKYEMSMKVNGVPTEAFSVAEGNVAISDTVKAVSKPGLKSWNLINLANSFENAFNYNRSLNSHLIKNSEWGAVAYLTHSQFGRNGTEIDKNSTAITGGGVGDKYRLNVKQSSTGNITGVYDLRGGLSEYVAAFNSRFSGERYTGAGYVSVTGKHFASYNGVSTRYATAYSFSAWATTVNAALMPGASYIRRFN